MADTFPRFPDAARALLAVDSLSEKEGQFCGGLAFPTKQDYRAEFEELAGRMKELERAEKARLLTEVEERMSRQARRYAERKQAPMEIQMYGHTYRRADDGR